MRTVQKDLVTTFIKFFFFALHAETFCIVYIQKIVAIFGTSSFHSTSDKVSNYDF